MEFHPGQKLSEISASDKPWDRHKCENDLVASLYGENPEYLNYQDRMNQCAPWLRFGEISPDEVRDHDRRIRLEKARFCRVRLCPVCAWRKSLALKVRFLRNWEEGGYREACSGFAYIHIVFTVQNPPMADLRVVLKAMNHAFGKLLKRDAVLKMCKGFIKSVEITRGKDGNPHPHFHVTIAVNPSYFTDRTYIKQAIWVQLWRDCMGLNYYPVVSVKRVKDRRKKKEGSDDLGAALVETVKYSVKSGDIMASENGGQFDREAKKAFLYGLTEQIKNLRFLEAGGCFRGVFKNRKQENDDVSDNEMMLKNENSESTTGLFFDFSWDGKRDYILANVFEMSQKKLE